MFNSKHFSPLHRIHQGLRSLGMSKMALATIKDPARQGTRTTFNFHLENLCPFVQLFQMSKTVQNIKEGKYTTCPSQLIILRLERFFNCKHFSPNHKIHQGFTCPVDWWGCQNGISHHNGPSWASQWVLRHLLARGK